ncbi:MAG TPA: sigma-70 family RNA polymerase sigma factor [Planctomycetes bacterium]|nr:sigma-70 family RNA polymerase sigma factor [Planctomycetota bacterium]HIL52004.1 sigma-70 family RNA polymerase sigma factor [Planctomycetota bacterium]
MLATPQSAGVFFARDGACLIGCPVFVSTTLTTKQKELCMPAVAAVSTSIKVKSSETQSTRTNPKASKPKGADKRQASAAKAPPSAALKERQALLDVLWAAYRAERCDETRNGLVEAYQGLVNDVARRFGVRLPRSVDRGDLITAANFGLMSAISGFDLDRGVRFETYCELRMRGALLDELRTQDYLPRPWRHRIERQKRTLERLRGELGGEPNDQEMAEAMGMTLDEYSKFFGIGLPGVPTGSMPVDDDDGPPILEVVPDKSCEAIGDNLTRQELMTLVTQKHTEQEIRILYLRYWEALPMREIGQLTGLSESRVCKIHAHLIERMQERLGVHLADD